MSGGRSVRGGGRKRSLWALAAVISVTGLGAAWLLTRSTPEAAPTTAQQVVYTVERRPFKAVVTLDASVVATPPTAVPRQRQSAEVEWTVRTGASVRAGEVVGAELPSTSSASGSDSGQSDARADLARARRQLQRLKGTIRLDIADAEAAVKGARPEGRAQAQRALARTRLTAQQSVDDLEGQIAALKRAGLAKDGRRIKLTAPVAGKVTIAPDGTTATVQPAGYLILAPVDPLVLYRLLDDSGRPISDGNTVRLTGLATEFTCTGLRLQDDVQASAAPPAADAGATSAATATTTAASCRVPDKVRVFTGLKATLAITVSDLPDALILDAAGIRTKSDDQGLVSVLGADGRAESRAIKIGQTDGLSVVVESGLTEGDRVVDPSSG